MKKAFFGLLVAGMVFLILALSAAQTPEVRPSFSRKEIFFEKRDGGLVSFNVEEALTEEQQKYGLMFKREMPAEEGMLFVFAEPKPAHFWMKNTFLPLDIVFIRPDGEISQISKGTPLDLTPILCDDDIGYVVELNEGIAEAKGIRKGDRLRLNQGDAK